MTKIAFVTTFCPHHRVKTFELLGQAVDTRFLFFSMGNEWYWQQNHGVRSGNFSYEYLPGVSLGPVQITPSLLGKLWNEEYDAYVKCINGRFALPLTYAIAKLKRKPFILWTGIWTRLQTPAHKLFFPITRHIYRHSDAIITYGEHVKRYLMTEGVPAERIFATTHAVDNEAYNFKVSTEELAALRQSLQIEAHQKVVLYLGRLETGKGLEYLIKAFAMLQIKDAVLVLAGTGSEAENIKQLAKAENIEDKVRFPGYIATNATVPYYALAWVYVLPSVTTKYIKETWGLVINEAFNQGVPVIATDAVGAAAGGLVQPNRNGYIVPEQDSAALAQALQEILHDAALRERLSANAQKTIAGWNNESMVLGFRQAIAYATRQSAMVSTEPTAQQS